MSLHIAFQMASQDISRHNDTHGIEHMFFIDERTKDQPSSLDP